MILIELVYNLALLVALSVVSGFIDTRWKRNTRAGVLLQGVVFGGASVIGMLRPFVFAPGLVFDGRSVMISLGGLFFGPWVAAAACLMTIPLRLAQGGPGAMTGVLVILSSAAIGVGCHVRRPLKSREITAAELLGFGVVVHLAMLAVMTTLPSDLILPVLKRIGWPVMLTYPLATVLIGKILSDQVARYGFLASLQASEARYRELVEHANSVILRMKPDGTITFFNEFAQRFFGFTPAEIVGRNVVGTIAPSTDTAGKNLASVLRDLGAQPERYASYENENIRKDGTRCWLAWTNQGILDEQGRCVAVLCVGNDITARKRIEAALHESEALLARSQQIAHIGSWMLDVTAKRLIWSDETYRIFGLMPQQFAATYEAFLAAVHPEDRAVVDAAYSGSLREGKDSYEIEHRIVRQQSGEIRYVHEKCVHERDAAGVVIRSVGMVQDITTRKRTEEKLRESEERYRLINASSRDSIYSYDRQGRFTHANLSLCNLLGLESGQIVGKTHEELGFTREHCQEWAKLHQQVYATDSTVINEMTTPIEGEALRCFEVVLNPMHDESGAIVGISGTTRDITARKRAEVALQEKLAELERINKLMIGRENRMIELKREINELCGQLNLPKRYSAPETIAPDSSQSKP